MNKILVVIPYLASAAQGKELQLSVAGWRKHFKEDFLIVVVGDYDPVVESGEDIMFIKCPRVNPRCCRKGDYVPHIDHVNKFMKVRSVFPDSEGFIYTCDDIYAVSDFTFDDVKKPKVRLLDIHGSFHHSNKWVRENYRTKTLLAKRGLPTMNWVCHLPVYYEWDKLLSIYEEYGCATKSRVVEQLYFNTYFADSQYDVLEEGDSETFWQFKFWERPENPGDLKDIIGKYVWIANSEKGWSTQIESALSSYYGL